MSKNDLIHKWIWYAVVTLGCLLVQSMICNHISLWGVHPVLLPFLIGVLAAYEHRASGLLFALIVGVLSDLTTTAIIPCYYTVAFVLAALLAITVARNLITPGFWCALASAAASLLACDLFYTVILIYRSAATFTGALSLIGREMLISLPFAFLLCWLCGKIFRSYKTE
jgi:cell shape-determining protein MreD